MNREPRAMPLLTLLLLLVSACSPETSTAPVETPPAASATPVTESRFDRDPPVERPAGRGAPASGDDGAVVSLDRESSTGTVWADGFEGELLMGMDGELYEAYDVNVIRWTQEALRERGLYSGPVNGFLDVRTMQAIHTLQAATRALIPSGIPSPNTRRLLTRGSHSG